MPKAAQVVLDSTKLTVRVDEIFNLKASVLPATASQQLTWQLSEPGIVDMLGGGSFRALQKGEVTITALALDGSGVKAECRVTVKGPTALTPTDAASRHHLQWVGSTLVLRGVQPGALVRLYSAAGKTLRSFVATSSEVQLDFALLPGVFLLETSDGFRQKVVR